MGTPQIIRTEAGEDLIVLSRRDYDALLARLGEPDGEDAMTARIVAETGTELERGDEVALPESVWQAIEAGDAPVKVLRLFRGLSQAQLAKTAGFSQAYIAEIETGRKNGTAESLKAIARALGVPLDVLVG